MPAWTLSRVAEISQGSALSQVRVTVSLLSGRLNRPARPGRALSRVASRTGTCLGSELPESARCRRASPCLARRAAPDAVLEHARPARARLPGALISPAGAGRGVLISLAPALSPSLPLSLPRPCLYCLSPPPNRDTRKSGRNQEDTPNNSPLMAGNSRQMCPHRPPPRTPPQRVPQQQRMPPPSPRLQPPHFPQARHPLTFHTTPLLAACLLSHGLSHAAWPAPSRNRSYLLPPSPQVLGRGPGERGAERGEGGKAPAHAPPGPPPPNCACCVCIRGIAYVALRVFACVRSAACVPRA